MAQIVGSDNSRSFEDTLRGVVHNILENKSLEDQRHILVTMDNARMNAAAIETLVANGTVDKVEHVTGYDKVYKWRGTDILLAFQPAYCPFFNICETVFGNSKSVIRHFPDMAKIQFKNSILSSFKAAAVNLKQFARHTSHLVFLKRSTMNWTTN